MFPPAVGGLPLPEEGGGGLANGFGGPCAPALRIDVVEGEGAGKTTPDEMFVSELFRAGVPEWLFLAEEPCGESSAVPLPPPSEDAPLGICTVKRGRLTAVT